MAVGSEGRPQARGKVQGPEGLRAADPGVSIQRGPCCFREPASTWSGVGAPAGTSRVVTKVRCQRPQGTGAQKGTQGPHTDAHTLPQITPITHTHTQTLMFI